jgi:hypothetical protein
MLTLAAGLEVLLRPLPGTVTFPGLPLLCLRPGDMLPTDSPRASLTLDAAAAACTAGACAGLYLLLYLGLGEEGLAGLPCWLLCPARGLYTSCTGLVVGTLLWRGLFVCPGPHDEWSPIGDVQHGTSVPMKGHARPGADKARGLDPNVPTLVAEVEGLRLLLLS